MTENPNEGGDVEKIFNRVLVKLNEESVKRALKKVREGLKTPTSRRATPVKPPQTRAQRAVTGTRQAASRTIDVAREVVPAFKRRFEALRKLTASQVRDAVSAYGRGLTNLALGRRASAPPTELPRPVEGQPPPPAAPARPQAIPTPVRTVPPTAPSRPRRRQVVIPPPMAPSATINNYLTDVVIDPSQMAEWRQLLRLWEQIKAQNRAMPKPGGQVVTYEWMSPEEKRDLEKTTFTRKALEDAGWAEDEIDKYLTEQERRAALYRALDNQLRTGKIVEADYRFREERITRVTRAQAAAMSGKKGGRAKVYRAGSFYFNRGFKGAAYSVPTMTRNRKLVAAARPAIEASRRRLYDTAGMDYRELRRVSTKNVRVFYPSKWNKRGRVALQGSAEAVDVLWMRRLGAMNQDRSTRNPLLRKLLQND